VVTTEVGAVYYGKQARGDSRVSQKEEETVELCLRGDRAAWESLYRSHYARVRRIVGWKRWGFSNNEVEDGIQEVFLEVIRSLHNFRSESNLGTFVTRIARNRCITHLRKKTAQKRGKEELGYIIEDVGGDSDQPRAIAIDGGPTPEDAMLAETESRLLGNALERLSGECQQIVRLRYFCQQSYSEMCGLLDLPLGTVCSRLKRCLGKLKLLMEKEVVG
jgi:RNA polymerase sigma-70 factor, ECF subfamily